jgi:hypothetical protein
MRTSGVWAPGDPKASATPRSGRCVYPHREVEILVSPVEIELLIHHQRRPSCATPRDADGFHSLGEITCAIGVGLGNGFGTGTVTALLGVTFNPVARTMATLNLGPAPSGAWSGVSCASPNDNNDKTRPTGTTGNSVACVATTGTTNTTTKITTNSNTMYAINFDPRSGLDPTTNAAPAWSSITFSDPENSTATPTSLPSCVSLDIDRNQISCGIVIPLEILWVSIPTRTKPSM